MKKGKAHHWSKNFDPNYAHPLSKAEEDKVSKKPYVPTGKSQGRPLLPEGEKKPVHVPTGAPKGRPPKKTE